MKTSKFDSFRRRLMELREHLTGAIGRSSGVVLTDDQPPEEHDGNVSETSEKELALVHTEERMRSQVMQALERLDRGTYGMCVACGGPISLERLDAIPYTRYCLQCERKVENV